MAYRILVQLRFFGFGALRASHSSALNAKYAYTSLYFNSGVCCVDGCDIDILT
jgi:hypothetical protein